MPSCQPCSQSDCAKSHRRKESPITLSSIRPEIQGESVDLLYVQSTDKNLMVPVGGAVVAGFSKELVTSVAELYPGRASASPSIDVFATLLFLGWSGWHDLVTQRAKTFSRLLAGLHILATSSADSRISSWRLLETPDNHISIALAWKLSEALNSSPEGKRCCQHLTLLGSQLFTQGCSGVR
ncbi:unnamed protein product [Protopolystoma xenopodis]|uniref:O-phosphoseryl-tRNA(Sec) selenium transferase n=1 Tax=Protopolystoma xenopodis TaxID=117903 RepID=A0A448X6K0_9PLAT|nr:unnamed protein product [Protopolystoma xenopodis]